MDWTRGEVVVVVAVGWVAGWDSVAAVRVDTVVLL